MNAKWEDFFFDARRQRKKGKNEKLPSEISKQQSENKNANDEEQKENKTRP